MPLLRSLLAFAAGCLIASAAHATPLPEPPELRTVGLGEAYALALQNDRRWLAARRQHEAALQAYPLARAGMLPVITLGGTYARVERETTLDGATSPSYNEPYYYSQNLVRLQLRQPVVNVGQLKRIDMAKEEVSIAELELALARQELARRLAETYFSLLLAQERASLADNEILAMDARLKQAERLLQAGVGTLTDVHEARAGLDRARADAIQAHSLVDVGRRRMAALIGHPAAAPQTLGPESHVIDPEPATLPPWIEAAGTQSLTVQARERAEAREAHNLQRARSQHLPTLDAVASYEYTTKTDLGYDSDRISRVGLELQLPLYAGGRVDAESEQAAARLAQAQEEVLLARNQAQVDASVAFAQLDSGRARIEALKVAVGSAAIALTGAQKSFAVAYRSFVDVLNAQQQLYRARTDLLEARIAHLLAYVRLHAAVGTLDDSVVVALDRWLQAPPTP